MTVPTCASSGRNRPIPFYAGPRLPRAQVARIGTAHCGDGSNEVRLLKINGRPGPNKFGYGSDWDGGFCVELQPGTYQVAIAYSNLNVLSRRNLRSKEDLQLTFTAQPGRDYVIDPAVVNETWQPRVVDAATGAVAASHDKVEKLCKTFIRALPSDEPDPTTCN